jgi:hypothetical protein
LTSFYFEDIFERYASEIDDLRSDSEGKDVLAKRVRDKHKEFSFLIGMIDSAPEMVAPAFHGAFGFSGGGLLYAASNSEPGDDGFPSWAELEASLEIAPWARPLINICLDKDGGESFLVTTAVLEWLLGSGLSARCAPEASRDDDDQDDQDDTDDLGEAGEEWMSEQGFDAVDR